VLIINNLNMRGICVRKSGKLNNLMGIPRIELFFYLMVFVYCLGGFVKALSQLNALFHRKICFKINHILGTLVLSAPIFLYFQFDRL